MIEALEERVEALERTVSKLSLEVHETRETTRQILLQGADIQKTVGELQREVQRALHIGRDEDKGGIFPRLGALERSVNRLWRVYWSVFGGLAMAALAGLGWLAKRLLEAL